MKKVLFCASTFSHLCSFHRPYMRAFRERGWEVWAAGADLRPLPEADRSVEIGFRKRFFSPKNLSAILQCRKLMAEEDFDLVLLHTTLAGAVLRAAALLMRRPPKIVYVCHGYLFGEGDGPRKWAYLLPEKLCARVTDTLLVMNAEDQAIAERHRLAGGRLCRIPGMGYDDAHFAPMPEKERAAGRAALGFGPGDLLFLFGGEFSARKDQATLIRAFAEALPALPDAYLLLPGDGALLADCRALADELGAAGRVRFPGRVDPMSGLTPLCDAVVSASRSEGLPFYLMEAMACGLPAAVSDVKGNRDLVAAGETGLLFPPDDLRALERDLILLHGDGALRARMGAAAKRRAGAYSLSAALPQILTLYGLEP